MAPSAWTFCAARGLLRYAEVARDGSLLDTGFECGRTYEKNQVI
jgi:hypothetical protein